MKETKYTKEDWISGKCALEWENDKAVNINKFFKECNIENSEASGNFKYYYCNEPSFKGYYCSNNSTNLPIIKIDDIVTEKKIIGWKLKKDCEKYREACKKIKFAQNRINSDYLEGKSEIWVGKYDTSLRECLEEAKVWDLWFEPVFEPEKPKEKNITLSNNKSVKIKKEGLYVEDRLIFIYDIESLFKTSKFANTEWIFQINNFDIGCYKNLNRKDLENIIEAYKSLN